MTSGRSASFVSVSYTHLAVLPVLHLTSIDLLLKFSLIQFSKPNGDFQFEVGILAQLVVGLSLIHI